jgi:hypothetical protein
VDDRSERAQIISKRDRFRNGEGHANHEPLETIISEFLGRCCFNPTRDAADDPTNTKGEPHRPLSLVTGEETVRLEVYRYVLSLLGPKITCDCDRLGRSHSERAAFVLPTTRTNETGSSADSLPAWKRVTLWRSSRF